MRKTTRPGMVLALLLLVGAIVLVVLTAIYQFSLDENFRVRRYRAGEAAYNVALSVGEEIFAHVAREANTPGSALRQRLVREEGPDPLLLATDPARGLVLTAADLSPARASPRSFALSRELGVEPNHVQFSATFFGFRPIEAGAVAGIRADPMEVQGFLRIRIRVPHQKVERTLLGQKEVRIASTLAPLFSKFTLAVAAQPHADVAGSGLNRVRMTLPESPLTTWPTTVDMPGGTPASPILLVNHSGVPWRRDGLQRATSSLFTRQSRLLARAGLVYLRADDSTPWTFNVADGDDLDRPNLRLTESFHLRQALYPCSLGPAGDGAEGMRGFHDGFFAGSGLFGTPPRIPAESPGGEVITQDTPWLRLYGDQAAIAPTFVFGPVNRRYVRYSRLGGSTGAILEHYPDAATWKGSSPLAARFGGDHARYAEHMARIVVEPYNRAIDSVLLSLERQTGVDSRGAMVLDTASRSPLSTDPPRVVPALLTAHPATAPTSDDDLAVSTPTAPGGPDVYQPTALDLRRGERPVFSGDLDRVLGGADRASFWAAYCERAARRVGYDFQDQQTLLARHCRGGVLRLPGSVRIAQGGLTLDDVTVLAGGSILVPGNVVLRGPIRVNGSARLTIISEKGSVQIDTPAPIAATIVALAGTLAAPEGLALQGSVAVSAIVLPRSIQGPHPRSITYDPFCDPTSSTYLAHTRYMQEESTLWSPE